MTNAQKARAALTVLLQKIGRPMTVHEIVELLRLHYGMHVTTSSAGANLGILRAAGVVERKAVARWEKPYYARGHWNTSTENWWWHTGAVSKDEARRFLRRVSIEVDMKLMTYQRSRGKPVTRKLPPRTDDMLQMLVDLGRV